MIQRSQEDRRAHVKGRKNLGRRKHERYSVKAYKIAIFIMFAIMVCHASFVIFNLK